MLNQFINEMRALYDSVDGDHESFKRELRRLMCKDQNISLGDIDDPLTDIKDIDTYIHLNMVDDVTPQDIDDINRYLNNQLSDNQIENLWDRMFANTKIFDTFKLMEIKVILDTGKPPKLRRYGES